MAKKQSPILEEEQDANPESSEEIAEETSQEESEITEAPVKKAEEVAPVAKDPATMTDGEKQAEFERIGRERILAAPLVPFMCPLEPGEKPGAVQFVHLNGYSLNIKKGVMVSIPQPIAEILSEKYEVALTAGENMRIDRDEKIENALL